MSRKDLAKLEGVMRNCMPSDLKIVDSNGNKRCEIPCFNIGTLATRVLCSTVCPHYGTSECPRTWDVSDELFVYNGREVPKMETVRIATLNGNIPIYRWRGERSQHLNELIECLSGKHVSVKNLPSMSELRKQYTTKRLPDPERYQRWVQMNGLPDVNVFKDKVMEIPYCVVTHMTALLMHKAGEDLDRVLVPVLPYIYGGSLKGYRGLMPAEYLITEEG